MYQTRLKELEFLQVLLVTQKITIMDKDLVDYGSKKVFSMLILRLVTNLSSEVVQKVQAQKNLDLVLPRKENLEKIVLAQQLKRSETTVVAVPH